MRGILTKKLVVSYCWIIDTVLFLPELISQFKLRISHGRKFWRLKILWPCTFYGEMAKNSLIRALESSWRVPLSTARGGGGVKMILRKFWISRVLLSSFHFLGFCSFTSTCWASTWAATSYPTSSRRASPLRQETHKHTMWKRPVKLKEM